MSRPSMESRRAHGTRQRFAELHREGTFVMPNAWDIGSAAVLASLGFPAIATTSSGHAASLGRHDQAVTLEELLAHAAAVADAVEVPVNVDAEHGFATDPTASQPPSVPSPGPVRPGARSRTTNHRPGGSSRSTRPRPAWRRPLESLTRPGWS